MRLTTKGRFAVTAMLDLALREQHGAVTLSAIGARQQISLSYLEQLFSRLRRAELVESTRGPGGGYSLGRKAEAITVADIILAVDQADDEPGTPERGQGLTRELWDRLSTNMVDYMRSVTLRDLVQEQLAKGVVVEAAAHSRRAIFSRAPTKPALVNAPNSVFALGRVLPAGR